MNFTPFGNHFTTTIPTIHQFTTKFTHDGTASTGVQTQTTQTTPGPEESMITQPNRYNHFGQQVVTPVKYQRDCSTQLTENMIPTSSPPQIGHHKYQNDHFNHVALGGYPNQGHEKRYDEANMQTEEMSSLVKRDEKHENGKYHVANGGYPPTPAPGMPPTWQSIATPGSTVADYLSHLPASTLPISLHHFLKYSAETIKKDVEPEHQPPPPPPPQQENNMKKKKKKKPPKEKKPRPKPGEIRLTTALDGSTLYCCPECHMAYPDKGLLEQHLMGHTMERRFFCDICGAGLKRKDHLTRHKQSHNPERPFVCTVCMKAFKRKEQLTLHFVIHSGEKRHVCTECGKGFYRKDHLRKHTRSHIARRVKAEISQNVPTQNNNNNHLGDNQMS
ncbi:ZnF_C2H2 [Nesidiocoris tenuis]|uniref:ZnF_C2H2 n=1 Tax=Nesidiocoris tenuis TaxID=355587 RepID=A0ABN7BG71_9HEMI|nr:ZnF_C2H2 [Nesidiocoris tenuis]